MLIELHRLAEEELFSGYQFYERQSANLGSYFLDSLYADLESHAIYAGIHRTVFGFLIVASGHPLTRRVWRRNSGFVDKDRLCQSYGMEEGC